MEELYHRLLLLFVDGVGLASAGESNPLSTVPMPALRRLLGGPLTLESCQQSDDLLLRPLDATLGVEGLPQSATGQASLFTGLNGARRLGRHQTGLPGPRMRELVESHGLFMRSRQAGLVTTFANPYSAAYLSDLETGRRKPSVTTCAALAGGLELRRIEDLTSGSAVTWDFCRDLAARRAEVELEPIDARQAGMDLASIASRHHLTVFETFLTDLAGHQKRGVAPSEALARLDAAIAGLESAGADDLTWLLTSDHGNVEDLSTRSHTRNPGSVPRGRAVGRSLRCRRVDSRRHPVDSALARRARLTLAAVATRRNCPTVPRRARIAGAPDRRKARVRDGADAYVPLAAPAGIGFAIRQGSNPRSGGVGTVFLGATGGGWG